MNTTKTDHVKQLIDQGLKSLIENLESGKSDQLTAYITAMAKFHRYSFRNIMLILSQFPDASRVAGFRAWKKLGRYVKKGEQSIMIIAPMIYRNQDEGDTTGPEDEPIIRYRAVHVFDLSQTDGDPLPHIPEASGDPRGYTDKIKALIQAKGITLEYTDNLGGAEGSSAGGRIRIRNGLAPAAEFSVLVHEFAHEMLHWTNGSKVGDQTLQETEAEAVAHIVSSAIGLHSSTSSSDYIQLYNGNAESLEASLDSIRKAASEIIAGLNPEDD